MSPNSILIYANGQIKLSWMSIYEPLRTNLCFLAIKRLWVLLNACVKESLTSKVPRPFFLVKNHSKLPFLLGSFKKIKNIFFWEWNCRILYLTFLKWCSKIFMTFDPIDLKILAFKVGKRFFFGMLACHFRWLWTLFVEKFWTTTMFE